MNKFDIFIVDFKYDDSDEYKRRPAVILNDFDVAALVSKVTSHAPRDNYPGEIQIKDLKSAGLKKSSTIRLSKIIKINKTSIYKKLGHLSDEDISSLRKAAKSMNINLESNYKTFKPKLNESNYIVDERGEDMGDRIKDSVLLKLDESTVIELPTIGYIDNKGRTILPASEHEDDDDFWTDLYKSEHDKLTEKLEIHDTLNPKIWNKDKTLRNDVKIALYDIIDEFVNNSNFLTKDDIITANIVGSNASYNYTDFSDLDLHLVVDFDELSSDGKFVGYASDSERVIFNRRYDIDINGVNAEIYVEDIKSLPVSNGIYDLYKETWIKQPVKLKAPEIDNNLYNNIYNKTKSEALKLLDTASSAKSIKDFINKLYIDRRESLAKDGEAGLYNQVFKDIRNEGILDNLKDLYYELRSEELSIDNDDTQLENILRQTAFGYNY